MKQAIQRRVREVLRPMNLTASQFWELVLPSRHSPHIRRHRAQLISSRVGLVSAIFAVLTPLWIVVDIIVFPWPTWSVLALLRLLSAAAFLALALPYEGRKTLRMSYLALGAMLAVPPVFYLVAHPFLMDVGDVGVTGMVARAYSLLPLVVVAGLSVFPLTALEVIIAAIPVFGVAAIGAAQGPGVTIEDYVNTAWLLMLVTGVAIFSGMSQLNYMIALINQAAKDLLTGAFTRRSGEEALELQFRIAMRTDQPMAVGFIDVDSFKTVNDDYGHEEGDRVLRTVADKLREILRRSDILVRWGGEEFVILLPNTDSKGVARVLQRFGEVGLGQRPDGTPVTVSMGVAELTRDTSEDWYHLVELADARMYKAKKSGKNRAIGPDPTSSTDSLVPCNAPS